VRPADEPLYTSEHRVPNEPDSRWLGRRARNVARRPLVLALFAAGAFLVALLAVIAAPFPTRQPAPPPLPSRQDTTNLVAQIARLEARVSIADSTLAGATAELNVSREVPAIVDTFPPALRARRGLLRSRIREVTGVIRRASDAPLPASYRALAEMPELAGDSTVAGLLDSLTAVERARAQAQTLGETDTTFMALTARVTQIGDSLVRIAERRVTAMRGEVVRLTPAPTELPPAEPIDTAPLRMAVDSARQARAAAERRLADARRHNESVAAMELRSQSVTGASASPGMLISAAAVSGLALGFLVALTGEMRKPAVADGREAEVVAGIPVLAHISEATPQARRTRRLADRDVPPLVDLTTDSYDRLYYRLADSVARLPQLAVLGDDPAVVAIVSANLAAAAARTARATLLLDADFDLGNVSNVLRVPRAPGMADILAKRVHWSSAIAHSVVGRDRVVDVLPAGTLSGGSSLAGAAASLGAEVAHIAGRYDTLIVNAPVSRRGAVSAVAAVVPDAIVCVRISRTSVRLLRRIVTEARADGARLRGLVLWTRSIEQADLVRPSASARKA
jgi:hypothetical protein